MKSLINKSSQGGSQKCLVLNPIEDSGISFSFRFFKQIDNFGVAGKDDIWFVGLLEQLKKLSEKTIDELLGDYTSRDAFRIHQLSFDSKKTALTKADFRHIPDKYKSESEDCGYYQFQISQANGRVVGFFNSNHKVFYIVFLDPNHNAQLSEYSNYKIREIKPCDSEIDDLYARISKHTTLKSELENESKEFLFEGDEYSYLCIEKDLLSPFVKAVTDCTFCEKFRTFLLDYL